MHQIQSFVEHWFLKFIVLFNLKSSDFIYLYKFVKIYVKNSIRWSIIFISMMLYNRMAQQASAIVANALTVLLRTAAFSVSGTIAVSGFTVSWSQLQIVAMEGN